MNDVDGSAADDVVDEIRAEGGTARVDSHDVSTWSGAEAAIAELVAAEGRLDVLVNNAGILRDAMSFSMTEEQWDDVIRVHLKGHVAPAHFAGIHWRERAKRRRGRSPVGSSTPPASRASTASPVRSTTRRRRPGIASMTVILGARAAQVRRDRQRDRPPGADAHDRDGARRADPEEGEFDEWDPANIAPGRGLAGRVDAAADITGQVVVVNGDKVHLMQGWHRVGADRQRRPAWTVADLEARTARAVRRARVEPAAPGFGE